MAKKKKHAAIHHEGRRYLPSKMTWPKGGVVRQYREDRPTHAGHMLVFKGGKKVVDHVDAYNPDHGPLHALKHLFVDVLGPGGTFAVGLGAFVALLIAIRSASSMTKKVEGIKDEIKKVGGQK